MNFSRRILLTFLKESLKTKNSTSRSSLKKINVRLLNTNFNNISGVTLTKYTFSRNAVLIGIGSSIISFYMINDSWKDNVCLQEKCLKAATESENADGEIKMSRREKRFHQFASCEYNGQIVMTPHDFMVSIIENQPKRRLGKIRLTHKDIDHMIATTPTIDEGSNTFFRDLHHNGVITYSEYLFLVTVLTKSSAGLKTALKMMDVNGDHLITFEEFHLIVNMINKSASKNTKNHIDEDLKLSHSTLFLHLFGAQSSDTVTFEKFFKFMDDFHDEVLELEFHEYSKSLKRISEIDFAKILLRNTILTEQEYLEYIDRMTDRIEHPKGVTLDQFKSFHDFLNNIEDFIIAVNMTNVMHQPVDKDLFSRAIRVTTGENIDPYIIDVIFKLFDNDGDGKLSQQEFIGIMKDRLKRGFGKFPNMKGFNGFKYCLKKEMTRPQD